MSELASPQEHFGLFHPIYFSSQSCGTGYAHLPTAACSRPDTLSISATLPVPLGRSQMDGFTFSYMHSFRPFWLIGESFRA